MIIGSCHWRPGSAAAGTLKRIVAPVPKRTTALMPRPQPASRPFHTTGDAVPPRLVTSHAFAAKPRRPSEGADDDAGSTKGAADSAKGAADSATPPAPPLQGTIDPNSDLGRWRSAVLHGGDAGEDAIMITEGPSGAGVLMGVADGVGGWTEAGIDPSQFSNALLYHASKYAEDKGALPAPQDALSHAYKKVEGDAGVQAGSSTACFVRLDVAKGTLASANLGDSGFVHLRPALDSAEGRLEVVHSSLPQLYGFNTPYQLAKVPERMRQAGSLSNTPADAALHEAELRQGDLVLVMTDGFLDNVHCKLPSKDALTVDAPQRAELLQLLDMLQDRHKELWTQKHKDATPLEEKQDFANVVTNTLIEYARLCQDTVEKVSPFQLDAARHGVHFPGGKVDDVALLCAIVV
ncbi:protein-serine/threonine phosphatase [Malassezia sp. CBS 17886]|nr:protein-serine/threonine phosphatase [Malassezia sp. CBS 17886]